MTTEMTCRAISPDLVEENSIRLRANAAGANANEPFKGSAERPGRVRSGRSVNGPPIQSCLFQASGPPSVTHKQCARIAYAAIANVGCRPRDEFHGLVLGLVGKRNFEKS